MNFSTFNLSNIEHLSIFLCLCRWDEKVKCVVSYCLLKITHMEKTRRMCGHMYTCSWATDALRKPKFIALLLSSLEYFYLNAEKQSSVEALTLTQDAQGDSG